ENSAEHTAEATSFWPAYAEYQLGTDRYLRQLEHLKKSLSIPVIASLNGCQPGGWTAYARKFEMAGADAVELNLYQLVTDPAISGDEVEARFVSTVQDVVKAVRIPVAVKLSPYHTSLVPFVMELEGAGAAGVVLFNRFYQPDFNLEDLEVQPQLRLSDSGELLLRLRWLAILSPHLRGSLAASGGVHSATDVVKSILAGAHAVQVVSAVLKHGPSILTTMLKDLTTWMSEHDYAHIGQVHGAMNLRRCPNPAAFERANYIRILQSWKV
ncbi:MAG TPA: dihydroorotate dehydrogenase-like protein, partial [Opitutaceae bacterium]|nr:dihydroorotate dehydrogenase-like protein [Opitutaceae bacterium]